MKKILLALAAVVTLGAASVPVAAQAETITTVRHVERHHVDRHRPSHWHRPRMTRCHVVKVRERHHGRWVVVTRRVCR